MESDAAAAHRALEAVWSRLYANTDGARFERRGDLLLARCPQFPVPQCNGAWIVEDTEAAADELAEVIAEVEAIGATACVQTRSGHERTRNAAAELGFTAREVEHGMVMRPGQLAQPSRDGLAIDRIAHDEVGEASAVLAASFGVPKQMTDAISTAFAALDETSCYVIRANGEAVATALGVTLDDVTGVFNVATLPRHRGRGYGAALTAHVVGHGFADGARLAFLQSSEAGNCVYRRLGFRAVEEYVLLTRPDA